MFKNIILSIDCYFSPFCELNICLKVVLLKWSRLPTVVVNQFTLLPPPSPVDWCWDICLWPLPQPFLTSVWRTVKRNFNASVFASRRHDGQVSGLSFSEVCLCKRYSVVLLCVRRWCCLVWLRFSRCAQDCLLEVFVRVFSVQKWRRMWGFW